MYNQFKAGTIRARMSTLVCAVQKKVASLPIRTVVHYSLSPTHDLLFIVSHSPTFSVLTPVAVSRTSPSHRASRDPDSVNP